MKDEATENETIKPKITKGTAGTPTTRAGRRARAGQKTITSEGVEKKARSARLRYFRPLISINCGLTSSLLPRVK